MGDVERRVAEIADKIERQAECLEGYAEQSGHHAKPVPSVFHSQATHFRDYANELRAALAKDRLSALPGDGS